MSDDNRNTDFLLNQSGQGGAPPYPQVPYDPNIPGYYNDVPGYAPTYPDYNYSQGAVPAPVAPYYSAPVQYDVYGNPIVYPQDYQQGGYNAYSPQPDPYNYAYTQPDPYAYGAMPYPQQPYPYANPYEQAYAPYPQQMPQMQEAPSGEFAQKFAEAAAQKKASNAVSQVTNKGLTGFDQLADALESQMATKARQDTNWPPKKEKEPEKPQTEAPKDVFDDSAVSLEIDKPKTAAKDDGRMDDSEIARIAQDLSQAVLLKSYSRAFNDNNLMKEGQQRCIEIENLLSDYYISEGGAPAYPMYRDITFGLNSGSCCALVSDVPLSTYVLARAVAENADAGYDEFVRVADSSDGRRGKVFYIGSDGMLPNDMTCEEFLLYTMASRRRTTDEDYEQLSILLSQVGMSNIQESVLTELSYNVRILILSLSAALNPNIVCVVVNDPRFRVEAEEEMMARRVFALINSRGKCSLLSCCSPFMMAAVANRVAVIKRGQLAFFGEYKRFLDDYCLGIMSFTVADSRAFAANFERAHPGISALSKDRLVYLVRRGGYPEVPLDALIKDIIALGADYNTIVMDEKSFGVACKEVLA